MWSLLDVFILWPEIDRDISERQVNIRQGSGTELIEVIGQRKEERFTGQVVP